ncbi:hypothetical protein CW749_26960 [Vibrio sp. vnigr-6D03]|nr:hypothetical protein CW749_26960 [Vibrio sp. vnigr-6D03]
MTPNAWRVYSGLKFVFTVQWFSLGVIALSHLNWALCTRRKNVRIFENGERNLFREQGKY